MGRASTVDGYIEGFDGPDREQLEQLRALARETVPEASEAMWSGWALLTAVGVVARRG
ncbi:hypothetical protein Psuf_066940 [Phytohabitans suffuscus]|uniref:Uncharacterized protein n=1 Tax=Phytohabitans suffuscus TaxID=624315 RepID=A0A6F8YU68_9ACTN|nr:hypothetical protein Psuf_066940 [Phytohabitans suffuscus]